MSHRRQTPRLVVRHLHKHWHWGTNIDIEAQTLTNIDKHWQTLTFVHYCKMCSKHPHSSSVQMNRQRSCLRHICTICVRTICRMSSQASWQIKEKWHSNEKPPCLASVKKKWGKYKDIVCNTSIATKPSGRPRWKRSRRAYHRHSLGWRSFRSGEKESKISLRSVQSMRRTKGK